MANTTKKTSTTSKSKSTKQPNKEVVSAQPEDVVVKKEEPKAPIVPKDIDTSMLITVRNGFQGKLVYKSKRTHEKYIWDEFGGEQEIELRELRNAKSSSKAFFINNWFMFDKEDAWVIDYLGLGQYYQNAIGIDDFDDIFESTPQKAEKIIANMSKGQKRSLAYRARQLVIDGKIDSRKMISTLEEALGTELIDH